MPIHFPFRRAIIQQWRTSQCRAVFWNSVGKTWPCFHSIHEMRRKRSVHLHLSVFSVPGWYAFSSESQMGSVNQLLAINLHNSIRIFRPLSLPKVCRQWKIKNQCPKTRQVCKWFVPPRIIKWLFILRKFVKGKEACRSTSSQAKFTCSNQRCEQKKLKLSFRTWGVYHHHNEEIVATLQHVEANMSLANSQPMGDVIDRMKLPGSPLQRQLYERQVGLQLCNVPDIPISGPSMCCEITVPLNQIWAMDSQS